MNRIELIESFQKCLNGSNSIYNELSTYIKANQYKEFTQAYRKYKKEDRIILHDIIIGFSIDVRQINKTDYKKITKFILFLLDQATTKIGINFLAGTNKAKLLEYHKNRWNPSNLHEMNDLNQGSLLLEIFARQDKDLLNCWYSSGIVDKKLLIETCLSTEFKEGINLLENKYKISKNSSFSLWVIEEILKKKARIEILKELPPATAHSLNETNQDIDWNFFLPLLNPSYPDKFKNVVAMTIENLVESKKAQMNDFFWKHERDVDYSKLARTVKMLMSLENDLVEKQVKNTKNKI